MPTRLLASTGALLAASAVALSAYAAHAAQGEARSQLYTAATFALAHGIALAALAPQARRRFTMLALAALLVGTLLFSGSLVYRHVVGVSLGLAPLGGSVMILAWLAHAADSLRR